jgi:hypothetical protein
MIAIHKRIIPISLLQIDDIMNKNDKKINLVIITPKNQMAKALEFKELLPSSIKSFSLNVIVIEENAIIEYGLENQKNIDAFYCFDLSKDICKFIQKFTIENKIPTFSYSAMGFKRGALLYIFLKNKIHIYMNKRTMKNSKINFNTQFLNMVKLYDY